MKYLFDLTSLSDNFSGIERFALNISQSFISQYPQYNYILVFKREVHQSFGEIVKQRNVECIVIPGRNKLWFSQILLTLCLYRKRADAYIFLAFPDPLLFFRKNTYTTIHDACCWDCGETMTIKSKLFFRVSFIKTILHSKRIITISEFSKKRIMEIGRINSEKIRVIFCGIDSRFSIGNETNFETIKLKYGLPEKYILTLSTLEPRKNLSLLLYAYSKLLKHDERIPDLVLAGRKGWKIDTLVSDFPTELMNHIHFTGFIDDVDLPIIYQQAQFFVFPSKYEGFGLPPLEAMSCGTLVLSSDAASLPEVLGDAAFYFKNDDATDLEIMLQKMIVIPECKKYEMVQRGLSRISLYSWNAESRKIEK